MKIKLIILLLSLSSLQVVYGMEQEESVQNSLLMEIDNKQIKEPELSKQEHDIICNILNILKNKYYLKFSEVSHHLEWGFSNCKELINKYKDFIIWKWFDNLPSERSKLVVIHTYLIQSRGISLQEAFSFNKYLAEYIENNKDAIIDKLRKNFNLDLGFYDKFTKLPVEYKLLLFHI